MQPSTPQLTLLAFWGRTEASVLIPSPQRAGSATECPDIPGPGFRAGAVDTTRKGSPSLPVISGQVQSPHRLLQNRVLQPCPLPCDTPAPLPSLCLFPPPTPQPPTSAGALLWLLLCQENSSTADLCVAGRSCDSISLPHPQGDGTQQSAGQR